LQQQVPRVWPGDPLDLGTRVLRDRIGASGESVLQFGQEPVDTLLRGGSRRSQAASRVITSVTVVTSSADAAPTALIGVVLIVAMRSGYWPVADRHSLRGQALRERGNRPDRSGSQQ